MATKKVKEFKVIPPKKVDTSKVELVSYTIKAIIPTGPYANLQPEITVKAKNLEEAEAYVIPHINKMFSNFLNISDRQNEPKITEKEIKVPTGGTVSMSPPNTPTGQSGTGQIASVPYHKASNAIENAMSLDALNLIEDQIQNSTKLSDLEKPELLTLVLIKRKELK